jgi:hypothetical protein
VISQLNETVRDIPSFVAVCIIVATLWRIPFLV